MARSFQELLHSLSILAEEHSSMKVELEALRSENAVFRAAMPELGSVPVHSKGPLPLAASDSVHAQLPGAILDDAEQSNEKDRQAGDAMKNELIEQTPSTTSNSNYRAEDMAIYRKGSKNSQKTSEGTPSVGQSGMFSVTPKPSLHQLNSVNSMSSCGPSQAYRLFLSHKQSNGQDAVLSLKMLLAERLPLAEFWLDLEQNPTATGMLDGVKNASHVVLFCTRGVTESKWILMEIRCAVQEAKPIVLIQETDSRHGAPDMTELIREAPADVRHVFEQNVAIPWYRDPSFRAVSLDKICERLSAATNDTASQASKDEALVYGASGEPVFDDLFAAFCSLAGLPLPGAGSAAHVWLRVQQVVAAISIVNLFIRCFFPEGPAYSDQRDNILTLSIVAAISVANIGLRSLLRSAVLREILETRIGNGEVPRMLRKWTRWLTFAGILMTLALTGLCEWTYTQSFFLPYYADKSTSLGVFFFYLGMGWVILLLPCVAQIWGCLVLILAVNAIIFMDLANCFKHFGVEVSSMLGVMTQASETDLVRFQCAYVEAWRNRIVICGKLSRLLMFLWCAWIVNLGLNLYYSLGHAWGTEHPLAGRGEDSLHLVFRVFVSFVLDVFVLVPFCFSFVFRRLQAWAARLIFTKPNVQTSAMLFVNDLELDFPVGPVSANSTLFHYYIAAVAVRMSLVIFDFQVFFA